MEKYFHINIIKACNYVACYLGCSFYAIAFTLLYWSDFDKVHREMYYAGHILVIGSILILLPFKGKKEKVKPK